MVHNVLVRAEVEVPVVLATHVYLNRAKPHLHIALEEWANERVFLGALIAASKVSISSSTAFGINVRDSCCPILLST
jgi:hypothetical protein